MDFYDNVFEKRALHDERGRPRDEQRGGGRVGAPRMGAVRAPRRRHRPVLDLRETHTAIVASGSPP